VYNKRRYLCQLLIGGMQVRIKRGEGSKQTPILVSIPRIDDYCTHAVSALISPSSPDSTNAGRMQLTSAYDIHYSPRVVNGLPVPSG